MTNPTTLRERAEAFSHARLSVHLVDITDALVAFAREEIRAEREAVVAAYAYSPGDAFFVGSGKHRNPDPLEEP